MLSQLLRPAAKLPGNRWEVGMRALHDGDGRGVWLALSPAVLRASALLTPALLLAHAVRGEGLPVSGLVRVGALRSAADNSACACRAVPPS